MYINLYTHTYFNEMMVLLIILFSLSRRLDRVSKSGNCVDFGTTLTSVQIFVHFLEQVISFL